MITLVQSDEKFKNALPIVGQKEYISAKSPYYGWFINRNYAIAFVIDKRAIFKRLIFMSKVVSLQNKTVSKEEEKEFLEDIIAYLKKNTLADFIYKAHANVVFQSCPNGAVCVPWGTYVVSLKEKDFFNNFNSKLRQKIRKALREGVQIKSTNNIELIYKIIKETMQRQNSIHYPSLEYLKSIQEKLPHQSRFYISLYKNKIQGCSVILFDKNRAYVPYAGSSSKVEHVGAIALMHYQAMEDMREKGVQEYDFMGARLYEKKGSKFSGINRFKRSFNPRIEKGYSFKYILNPLKYSLFTLSSKLYLRLKGYRYEEPIDTILQEMNSLKAS